MAADLKYNYLDLKVHGDIPFVSGEYVCVCQCCPVESECRSDSQLIASEMPNPLQELAGGDELYMSFINVWADEVGTNTTKLINVHKNIYLAHVNIPGALL